MSKGQQTRQHILKESRRLFTVHGFQNTSISDIIVATGVKKGNLYYHFPSKEELGLAVLTDARDEFFTILEESLQGATPTERILNSCNAILELMQQTDFVGGCLFGNTALEMTDSNPRFQEILEDVFNHWVEVLQSELEKIKPHSGPSTLSSHALAVTIVAALEGGIMLARVYKNKHALQDCILSIAQLIR